MSDLHDKIKTHVARIERHQKTLGLSDSAFTARYAKYLGSAKTYKDRLLKGKFEEFGQSLERWEHKLAAMVAELDGRALPETFHAEMPFAQALTSIYTRLQAQQNDRRCGVALAVTGVGKSAWGQWMASSRPRDVLYIRANETWRENKSQIARSLAGLVGADTTPYTSGGTALAAAIEKLKLSPLTIVVDEAHEGGLMVLKIIKTLIDSTPARFILLAYPTSWERMMSATDAARAEAQQIFGRTLKPVFAAYRNGTLRTDVAAYLRMAAGMDGEADAVASQILPLVRSNGNLRLLADAVEEAVAQADLTGTNVTAEAVIAHVEALCPATMKGGK